MAKQTLFNASMEESMNLVTEKYVATSMKDVQENGYIKKIIGFLVIDFFNFLFYLFGTYYIDEQGLYLLVETTYIFRVPLLIGLAVTVFYLYDTRKIKNNRYLSYYLFNKDVALLVYCMFLQCEVIAAIAYSELFNPYVGVIFVSLLLIFVVIERVLWFYKDVTKSLYENQDFSVPLARFLEQFVVFSKKYGGVAVALIFAIRAFFFSSMDAQEYDLMRMIGMLTAPFIFLLPIYFTSNLWAESFIGYYVKKYSEEYRVLFDYSIEEWYGPKSKRFKEMSKEKSLK